MGSKKKLLLLALLIVTSVSYSKTVTSGTGIWAAGKEGINKENEELIVTNGAIGINVKYEKEKEGTGINNGIIKVTGKNSKGIFINNTSNTKNKNSAKNENRIEVLNNGIGVYFNSGSDGNFYNNKEMIISDKDSKGIFINSKGNAENNGDIFVGYKVDENGQIVNGGAGAIGVQVNNDSAEFINKSTGNIYIQGDSKGIQVNKGIATNQGIIEATGKNATGVYMNGEAGNFENKKNIEASGESSKAIFFGVDGGTATNNGIIEVKDGGTGVFSYKGKLDGDKPTPSKNQNNFTNGKDGIINVYGKKSVGLLLDTLNGIC